MASTPSEPIGIAAVRGAVPVRANRSEEIVSATARLLTALLDVNGLTREQIVSALFTSTDDLDADFPAHAARRLGWTDVPLLNAREIPVPGAMPRVVRVLLTVHGVMPGTRLAPVYLDDAAGLRPDLAAMPADAPRATHRVALIGLGQIGGSIGRALGRRGGWRRVGYDRDPAVTGAALAARAIDEAAGSLAEACAGAELAVLATPVDTLPALIAEAAQALPRGAALIDTGSARAAVTPALEAAAARGVRAVGGHPLAGSEGHGFAASRADLFTGATFTLSAAGGAEVPAIVDRLLRDLGARRLEVEPGRHDRALARTSHLPYLVACALREVGSDAFAAGLSGPGFRDMTRLAAGDPRIAGAYCRANAHEVADAWQALRAALDRAVAGLAAGA